ncbi:MAG: serine/threonine protein kinase [Bdellovibrionales bacterium]
MPQSPQSSANPHGGIALGTRVEIFPHTPLPEFDTIGGTAFACRFKGGEEAADLVAVLCNKGLQPRADVITSMRSIDHASLLRLLESGVAQWSNEPVSRAFAFAYQRPLASRFKQSIDETHTPLSEDALNHHFVAPMISALQELARVGLVHGGIRPTNIFWRLGSATAPQLGECLSSPPGYDQPALFEPIERAMSLPMGRGSGDALDDCYAFGVTLALMILGHNPLQGVDDKTITQMKIERGSFATLVGNKRLPATYIELLRGLLADEPRLRWNAADLEQWQSGRRLTVKNADIGRHASRAISFAGREYWQIRPLAAALAAHVPEAARILENGHLEKWLRRALGDEIKANDLDEARKSLKESGKSAHYEEQLVARACVALDPSSPIHYRGITLLPTGIAGMLVEMVTAGNSANIQILSEIISSQLITFWIEMQKEAKTDLVPLGQQYERMRALLEKTTFGNGVERILYELNPSLPCFSPLIRAHYVISPKSLLAALEHVAATNRSREPIDRHIAAFLLARGHRNELLFEAIAAPDSSSRRGVALLTVFSELQFRYGPDALPNLAQWILPMLEPATQRFLGKRMKESLRATMKESANKGDLGKMLQLVDDPKRIERDQQDFLAARLLYLSTLKEINTLETRMANRNIMIQSFGKPLAASLSSFLSIILILLIAGRALWQTLK